MTLEDSILARRRHVMRRAHGLRNVRTKVPPETKRALLEDLGAA